MSATIGICMTNPMDPGVAFGQPFFEQLWRGIMHQADLDNYALLHYPRPIRDGLRSDPFLDGRVDGMLLHDHNDTRALELSSAGMPLVLLTRSHRIPSGCGYVHADEDLTTDLAMGHLWELGHRRIGYIAGPVGDYLPVQGATMFGFTTDDVAIARLEGFIRWTQKRNIYDPTLIIAACDWTAPEARSILKTFQAIDHPPTAIFCANDGLAMDIVRAARDIGLSIPEDLSVVGVDNVPQSREHDVSLTTIDVDVEEIGKEAFKALLRLMRGGSADRYQITLPISKLVVRGTTATRRPKACLVRW